LHEQVEDMRQEQVQTVAAIVKRQSSHLSRIVDDLLDVSRITRIARNSSLRRSALRRFPSAILSAAIGTLGGITFGGSEGSPAGIRALQLPLAARLRALLRHQANQSEARNLLRIC
jgi:signal transduction histidine kinase